MNQEVTRMDNKLVEKLKEEFDYRLKTWKEEIISTYGEQTFSYIKELIETAQTIEDFESINRSFDLIDTDRVNIKYIIDEFYENR